MALKAPCLSLPAQRAPLDLCLSSSLFSLYPNHWKTGKRGLRRAVLLKETLHSSEFLLPQPTTPKCENRGGGRSIQKCGDTHREARPILPILVEARSTLHSGQRRPTSELLSGLSKQKRKVCRSMWACMWRQSCHDTIKGWGSQPPVPSLVTCKEAEQTGSSPLHEL